MKLLVEVSVNGGYAIYIFFRGAYSYVFLSGQFPSTAFPLYVTEMELRK